MLEDGLDAAALFPGIHGLGAGPRRFPTDVHDVGARLLHAQRFVHGPLGIDELSAVSEGIGRDVEHAHHQGSFAQDERRYAWQRHNVAPAGSEHRSAKWEVPSAK